MPGQPTFSVAAPAGDYAKPGVSMSKGATGQGTHMAFIVWVVLLGIVLPAAILGGLRLGGFSFVFKGR